MFALYPIQNCMVYINTPLEIALADVLSGKKQKRQKAIYGQSDHN
jgi:hypothetical protein